MLIHCQSQTLELMPQKAVFWQEQNALLISDVHVGKIAHFRREGIPVPQEAMQDNFQRLNQLIDLKTPEKLYILGDLFHSTPNEEWDLFFSWLQENQKLKVEVILGNHDRSMPLFSFPQHLVMHTEALNVNSLLLRHDPADEMVDDTFAICGHIHPVSVLRKRGLRLRLPCFYMRKKQLILPGFGYFTGGYEVKAKPGERIFAAAENLLVEIK